MDFLTVVLGGLTIASACGAIAGTFFAVSQKTIINTLHESNTAYAERNKQLEDDAIRRDKEYAAKLAELEGRIKGLEALKLEPIVKILQKNHKEVMAAIGKETKK